MPTIRRFSADLTQHQSWKQFKLEIWGHTGGFNDRSNQRGNKDQWFAPCQLLWPLAQCFHQALSNIALLIWDMTLAWYLTHTFTHTNTNTHTTLSSCHLRSKCLIVSFIQPHQLSPQFIVFSQLWSLLCHTCLAQLPKIIYYQRNNKAARGRKTGKSSVILYRICVALISLFMAPHPEPRCSLYTLDEIL